jgi:serine/threonine protein kinase
MIGKSLGQYEILAPLGVGGMGEVYRAHDPSLKRDIAIKVLPEALADDPERLARLEREAHSLAALNHPNVATIHGLESAGGIRFLVLELVEGETLADRIGAGPLDVEEALRIAAQIAEGLEAAHASGIIHRDLKPANVKITPEGRVKVLDFGLAKATDAMTGAVSGSGAGTAALTHSPTITAGATEAGVLLGTAPY